MPGLDHGVLREVGVFIAERLDAFTPASGKPQALVHVDAHFGNIMWDDRNEAGGGREGRISALLDFAGARLPEPPEAALMDRVLQRVPREMLRGGRAGSSARRRSPPSASWMDASTPSWDGSRRAPATSGHARPTGGCRRGDRL